MVFASSVAKERLRIYSQGGQTGVRTFKLDVDASIRIYGNHAKVWDRLRFQPWAPKTLVQAPTGQQRQASSPVLKSTKQKARDKPERLQPCSRLGLNDAYS
jgi:hypothetical protein